VSRLSEVEVASALVRPAREKAFTVAERDRPLASLADDLATLMIVEFTPETTSAARAPLVCSAIAAGWCRRATRELPLSPTRNEPAAPFWRLTIASQRRHVMNG
jgi:hypothetical protein